MGYKPQANPHLTTVLLSSCQKYLDIQQHLLSSHYAKAMVILIQFLKAN